MSVGNTITLSVKLWEEYRKAYFELQALEAHGVDNWEGYGEAMATIYDEDEEDDNE